jgi:hypothetical protein
MFNRLLPSRILCLHTATVLLFAGSVGSQSPCPAGETLVRTGPSGPVCARPSRPPPCVGGQRRVGRRCECPASHPNFDSSRQLCIWPCEANTQWNADSNECVSNTPPPPPAPPPPAPPAPPTPTADDARQWLADQMEQYSSFRHNNCRRAGASSEHCSQFERGNGSSFQESLRYRRPTLQQCSFSIIDSRSEESLVAMPSGNDWESTRETLISLSGNWGMLDSSTLEVGTSTHDNPTVYFVVSSLLPGQSLSQTTTWTTWNNRYGSRDHRSSEYPTTLRIRFTSENIARRAIPAIQLLIRACSGTAAF